MGYDSRDGQRERVLWGERANYHRPLITPDGEQVVYSNRQTRMIYVINWDGSPPRLIKESGCASEVWRDPKTGRTWVYYQEDPDNYAKPVLRFPIDDPDKVERAWSSSQVQALPSFQLSRDGEHGSFHVSLADFRRRATSRTSPGASIVMVAGLPWRRTTATSHGHLMDLIETCS